MAAGAILAGGRSRRFGSDKARALWRGRTLIEHAATSLYQAGLFPLFVVGGSTEGLPAGLEHVDDMFPGEGPLGGIVSALSASCDDLVVIACDTVRLVPGAIAALLGHPGGESVVIPRWRGELQPLCALYRTSALASLAMDYAAGERSVIAAIGHLERHEVPFPDDSLLFVNVNTREDLERLETASGAGRNLEEQS